MAPHIFHRSDGHHISILMCLCTHPSVQNPHTDRSNPPYHIGPALQIRVRVWGGKAGHASAGHSLALNDTHAQICMRVGGWGEAGEGRAWRAALEIYHVAKPILLAHRLMSPMQFVLQLSRQVSKSTEHTSIIRTIMTYANVAV